MARTKVNKEVILKLRDLFNSGYSYTLPQIMRKLARQDRTSKTNWKYPKIARSASTYIRDTQEVLTALQYLMDKGVVKIHEDFPRPTFKFFTPEPLTALFKNKY